MKKKATATSTGSIDFIEREEHEGCNGRERQGRHAMCEVMERTLDREEQEQTVVVEMKKTSIKAQLQDECYSSEVQDESVGVEVEERPDVRKEESIRKELQEQSIERESVQEGCIKTEVPEECIKKQDNFTLDVKRVSFEEDKGELVGREAVDELCQAKEPNTKESTYSKLITTVDLVKKDVNNCIDGIEIILKELKTIHDPYVEPSYGRHEIIVENEEEDVLSILLTCQEYARRNKETTEALLKKCKDNIIWNCREKLN